MSSEETIYNRVEKLEDEIAALISEVDTIKKAARNVIVRYEIEMIKKGNKVNSIIN